MIDTTQGRPHHENTFAFNREQEETKHHPQRLENSSSYESPDEFNRNHQYQSDKDKDNGENTNARRDLSGNDTNTIPEDVIQRQVELVLQRMMLQQQQNQSHQHHQSRESSPTSNLGAAATSQPPYLTSQQV